MISRTASGRTQFGAESGSCASISKKDRSARSASGNAPPVCLPLSSGSVGSIPTAPTSHPIC